MKWKFDPDGLKALPFARAASVCDPSSARSRRSLSLDHVDLQLRIGGRNVRRRQAEIAADHVAALRDGVGPVTNSASPCRRPAIPTAPACRFFGMTDLGVSFGVKAGVTAPPDSDVFVLPKDRTPNATSRVITDLGVMRNFGPHDAIGVSWFITTDDVGRTGPAIHYRRWLKSRRSLDVGVGVPLADSEPFENTRIGPGGSLLGLVKYNPVPWMGIAVRPEVVRLRTGYDCSTAPCVGITESTRRVLVGIEFSQKPGAIISAVAWGLFGLLGH